VKDLWFEVFNQVKFAIRFLIIKRKTAMTPNTGKSPLCLISFALWKINTSMSTISNKKQRKVCRAIKIPSEGRNKNSADVEFILFFTFQNKRFLLVRNFFSIHNFSVSKYRSNIKLKIKQHITLFTSHLLSVMLNSRVKIIKINFPMKWQMK